MQNLNTLDWNEILIKIKLFATSESGKERINKISPLPSPEQAQISLKEILQAAEVIGTGQRPFMQSLDLFSQWYLRVKKKAVLKTIEMKDVRLFCLEVLALKEIFKTLPNNDWVQRQNSQLEDPTDVISAIDQVLTPNGEIRSDASETLFRLFREKDRLSKEVLVSMDRLVRDHKMENIVQDKYVTTRDGRWVIPVKSGMQHHMPGIIHGSSQTKQTVFMEPEKVIPINNRLRQIEVEIEDEIEKILTELSHYISSHSDNFQIAQTVLENVDVRLAQAQFAQMTQSSSFEFSDDFELSEVRHPLLVLSGKNVVPNSVSLSSEKRILLLSGPNAGGKTILLKSMGIAAQMARCGLPICALPQSKIPFFEKLIIGIGDSQSVDENLSTFAAHLKILSEAARLKSPQSLILIDEICGSTDPEEGSALARGFIEEFSANDVYAVITSHLGPLKSGWKPTDKLLNGSLEYDPKSGRPTYQFISGIPGDSLAIQTAKRVGVDQKIVNRAIESLSPATKARLHALDELETLKLEISQLQDQLRKELKKANDKKFKYDQLLNQFNKEKEDWLSKTLKKAEKKVDEAIAHAKVENVFRKHSALQEIKYQLPEIVKAKKIETQVGINSADEFEKKYPPGTKVFVNSIQQDGIVQSAPNSKGEVMILSNSIRLQLPWQELQPPIKPQNPTSQLVRQSSGRIQVALADEDRTLDLRGKTVEEAIEELEMALDKALHNKEDRIKIIHGHGTEALKKAVRSHLSRSICVKKWKAANPEGGGDGVTWAEIGDA